MKKREKTGFAGESNSSGFKIEFCKIVGSETTSLVEAQSRNYNPNVDAFPKKITSNNKTKLIIRFIFLFFLYSAILIGNHFLLAGKLIVTAMEGDLFTQIFFNFCAHFFLLLISFIIAVNNIVDLSKIIKQWHACEHKLGNLFEQKIEISLENLRKMSRAHWRCGYAATVYVSSIITLIFAGSYLVLSCLVKLGLLPGLTLIGIVIGIWAISLILIAYIFTTAKPTEEQLEETLRVGKEFKAKLEKLEKEKQNF